MPSPLFNWAFDSQMPWEWNELVVSMCTWKRWLWVHRTEAYQQAMDNEISATEEVWLNRDLVSTRAQTAATMRLAVLDDSEEQLQVLKEKYSRSQGQSLALRPSDRVRLLQESRCDKGKEYPKVAPAVAGRVC